MNRSTARREVPQSTLVRYCARELEDGTNCGHHLIVHKGEGRCTGRNVWGGPCSCSGFVETQMESQ